MDKVQMYSLAWIVINLALYSVAMGTAKNSRGVRGALAKMATWAGLSCPIYGRIFGWW